MTKLDGGNGVGFVRVDLLLLIGTMQDALSTT